MLSPLVLGLALFQSSALQQEQRLQMQQLERWAHSSHETEVDKRHTAEKLDAEYRNLLDQFTLAYRDYLRELVNKGVRNVKKEREMLRRFEAVEKFLRVY